MAQELIEMFAQPGIDSATVNGVTAQSTTLNVYPGNATIISAVFQNQNSTGLAYAFFIFDTWTPYNLTCKIGAHLSPNLSQSTVYMHDDSGNALPEQAIVTGQAQSSSKCTLYPSGSTVSVSPDGSQYTVTVQVVFNDPFNGVKYVWLDGYDNNMTSSNWYCPNASFTVQSTNYSPHTNYVSPGSTSGPVPPGQIQQFQYSTSDPNGSSTMFQTQLVFGQGTTWAPGYDFYPGNPVGVGTTRCKIVQNSDFISLENDTQDGYVGNIYAPFGSASPISNSQCTVYPSLSSDTETSLQSQTITFGVAFTPSFVGAIQSHMYAIDNFSAEYWDAQSDGTWTWNVSDPYAAPDSQPGVYSNYLTPPQPPTAACNISGNWNDSLSTGIWSLTQPGNTVSGSLTLHSNQCGTVTWGVGGTYSSGIAYLNATNPSPSVDGCGVPAGTNSATITFTSCNSGQITETATRPSYVNTFQQTIPAQTLTGSGTVTLPGQATHFNVAPFPLIPLSTGDTNVTITTSSSPYSIPLSNVNYVVNSAGNPGSSCGVSLSIPPADGVGSAVSTITASPSGCSGIFNTEAAVAGTTSGNITQIVVPPQVLLQVLYGEAHGQAVVYGPNDPSQQAVGITIRNRFNDPLFSGSTTYQNTIVASQFNGINTSLTTGTTAQGTPTAELLNAAAVFGGSSAVSVGNAKCFFSPTGDGWTKIQAALSTGTTTVPVVTADPRCFGSHRQLIVKQSISTNTNGSGAPAFIFQQWRNLTDPAVIQIP